MNWKEQFISKFKHEDSDDFIDPETDMPDVTDFISTEIIEMLIADIPDGDWTHNTSDMKLVDVKQQLRDKWL